MMRYDKRAAVPRVRRAAVRLTDFSRGLNRDREENVLPLRYAAMCYNYAFADGALRDGVGAAPLRLPAPYNQADLGRIEGERPLRVWHYRRYDDDSERADDRLVVFTESGRLYTARLYGSGGFTELAGAVLQYPVPPLGINYRLNGEDVFILCSAHTAMLVWNGVQPPYVVEDAPRITSMEIHGERLFAVAAGRRDAVWFSEDLDPTNWEIGLANAGFIEMADERGAMLKAVSFLDYVYVFREYGISRLSAYGGQESFAAGQLFVSGGRIREGSICVCGDRILFLCGDGLYQFDGIGTRPIVTALRPLLSDTEGGAITAAYAGGKYYLACRYDFADGRRIACETGAYTNNLLAEVDLSTGACCLSRGLDIRQLSVLRCGGPDLVLACVMQDGAGYLTALDRSGRNPAGAVLPKSWRTPDSDLGSDEIKTLRYITLRCEKALTLRVISERGERRFALPGGRGVQRQRIGMRGRCIAVEFLSETDGVYLSAPTLHFDLTAR